MEQEINQQQFSQPEQKSGGMKKLVFVGIISSILGALTVGGIIYFVINNSYSEKQKKSSEEISALQNQITELEKNKTVQSLPDQIQS